MNISASNKMIDTIKRHISPGLFLFMLAPVLAELLSGHQPPLEFFKPLNLLLLELPYGCGALICRELVVRWGKGRFSLLLLGIAYGLYEEGIVVRSIFNPDWMELEGLGAYSHIAGITWTYAELLIHFHVIVSIIASVMLTEIVYPEQRQKRWISDKKLMGCIIALSLWIPAGVFMTSYFPSFGLYIMVWIIFSALVAAARYVPAHPLPSLTVSVPRPFRFWLLGTLTMTVFFFTVYMTGSYQTPPFLMTALFLLALDCGTLWLVLHWSGNGFSWDDRHRLALLAGWLSFFIYMCFLQDAEQWRGLSIVGFIAAISLWQLSRYIAKRTHLTS